MLRFYDDMLIYTDSKQLFCTALMMEFSVGSVKLLPMAYPPEN